MLILRSLDRLQRAVLCEHGRSLIAALPTFFMPYRAIVEVAKIMGPRQSCVAALWSPASIIEVRGARRFRRARLIVAPKHQSAWETFALVPLFDNPLSSSNANCMWIPIFGWLTIKGRMVPVDRSAGSQALNA